MSAQESAPTSSPIITPEQAMLLDFLRDHDAACPLCGYNVRALTRPVCPECKQELTLTVGLSHLRIGWLFTALAPGFFSGIAAFFLLIPIFARLYLGDGVFMLLPALMDCFGWCSGIFALLLAFRWRIWFLAQPHSRQRWLALLIWFIHIAALAMFIMAGILYG